MRYLKTLTLLFSILVTFSTSHASTEKEEFPRGHKFVFFAVLEGLYEDGVSEPMVKVILGERIYENFVVSCPICTPAYDAFKVFESRANFIAKKSGVRRDFGKGLSIEDRKALVGTPDERRKKIRALISKWIEAKIKSQNLNPKQEKDLRDELKKMSEEGGKALKRLKNKEHGEGYARAYRDWEFCPACEGSTLHAPKDK